MITTKRRCKDVFSYLWFDQSNQRSMLRYLLLACLIQLSLQGYHYPTIVVEVESIILNFANETFTGKWIGNQDSGEFICNSNSIGSCYLIIATTNTPCPYTPDDDSSNDVSPSSESPEEIRLLQGIIALLIIGFSFAGLGSCIYFSYFLNRRDLKRNVLLTS